MVHQHGVTGALGEGMLGRALLIQPTVANSRVLDGIHVDMNHLKKGEVKYDVALFRLFAAANRRLS